MSFLIAADPEQTVEGGKWITPLVYHNNDPDGVNYYNNLSVSPYTSSYSQLTKANSKIAVYGPIIKELHWQGANKVMVDGVGFNPELQDGINLDSMSLSGLHVIDNEGDLHYQGYIQGGFYKNDFNLPSFMLVNRRSVYELIPPPGTNWMLVDEAFEDAPSQAISLTPAVGAGAMFGTETVSFIDPCDNRIYSLDGQNLDVVIDIAPGDGIYLQMAGCMPQIVTNDATYQHLVAISGNVTIDNGALVVINPDSESYIDDNAVVLVKNGSHLTFNGIAHIGNNAKFVVESGSSISFYGTECTWKPGSGIEIQGGSLSAVNGLWDTEDQDLTWAGIIAIDNSNVNIRGMQIHNAHKITVTNSNLTLRDSRIYVPENGYGLLLSNAEEGHTTEISAIASGSGFWGTSGTHDYGIGLGIMKNPVQIIKQQFNNLEWGIYKPARSYYWDTAEHCSFSNCSTGIRLLSDYYKGEIDHCTFLGGVAGITLVAAMPSVTNCTFNGCSMGIFSEYSIFVLGLPNGLDSCVFVNCVTGIVSRNSNHRIKNSLFNHNQTGILSHAGSNLNVSADANNVLNNHISNVQFMDTDPYKSSIQLIKGHNDFYHLNDTCISSDFFFDRNYYDGQGNQTVEASCNWFQDLQYTVNDPHYMNYVNVGCYDPEPNMPAPPPENDRFYRALDLESQGQSDQALCIYKLILDENLGTEKAYQSMALDGVSRLSMIAEPMTELIDYLDLKVLQYAVADSQLCALMKDYLGKCFVINEDYQSAIDLIQFRIDNPFSEIDSLRAVLDLEIVLQLASLGEGKKPITTKYTQYKYPNLQVFAAKHDENWVKLYALMNKGINDTGIPIPTVPVISSNYPNPFNPSTTIVFSLPIKAKMKLSIFNLKGQKVRDLVDTEMDSGQHKVVWGGHDKNGRSVSSGIYFIKLDSGGKSSVRKAMLMK
ncbi:MAG: T9SS type A sorting domain-containing protein [Candidatus Cloacimonas sp.]|jgi:hypothetical protein|nr:T9SS type A sorting domain-containing protein [Candidatus Cloacimonas sp.]